MASDETIKMYYEAFVKALEGSEPEEEALRQLWIDRPVDPTPRDNWQSAIDGIRKFKQERPEAIKTYVDIMRKAIQGVERGRTSE